MDCGKYDIRHDERGLSLIEVLMAVTIMAIISIVVMSYFVSAMEKSADESRRIIAINLARQMQQEVRRVAADPNVFNELTNQVSSAPAPSHSIILTPLTLDSNSLKNAFMTKDASGAEVSRLAGQELNGTEYRFRISLEPTHTLDTLKFGLTDAKAKKLLRMKTTVYWQIPESAVETQEPSARMSASLDSYLVQ
ncbi:type IV pilus modification PilV family protein [Gorillibacterium massiliense]|uniref:type IV pilus modification PilV family protein n=1 Tax=Gorillibacterium massiliense TaxID=1280390 RepID=UPI0004B6D369|nr:type II secretion system protein [Gorillibacterium massiliense]